MQPELEMVHLQLTRSCNLHCPFCGQTHGDPQGALQLHDWMNILDQLTEYAPGAKVFMWGGEPLLSPHFEPVTDRAFELGFPLNIITNGTLIDRHAETLCRKFQNIFLSVDGPEEIHDFIRGRGVFARVRKNLELLKNRCGKLVMMSVMSPETMAYMKLAPFGLPVDQIILHEMIYLTDEECKGYPPDFASAWRKNNYAGYPEQLKQTIEDLKQVNFPCPAEFQPHFREGMCREPYRHLHIGITGETSFCTDFVEESMGNIREHSIKEIFEGEKAEQFRSRGATPYCAHCSWKNTEKTVVHFTTKKGEF